MIRKLFFYTSTLFIITFLVFEVQADSPSQYKVEFNKDDFKPSPLFIEIEGKKIPKAPIIEKFQRQIGIANKELKEKTKQKEKENPLKITTINVVKECTASVSCGGGNTISCNIDNMGTCQSGMHSVACITEKKVETKVCDLQEEQDFVHVR